MQELLTNCQSIVANNVYTIANWNIALILKENPPKMEIFSAMLLGPFEQLEREFGWEGGSYWKKIQIMV